MPGLEQGQGQDPSLPLCVITRLAEEAGIVQQWQQLLHLSWTLGCFQGATGSWPRLGEPRKPDGGPQLLFSRGHGEPQKALELEEQRAKWSRFKCVSDKGSALGFEICPRIHKVCFCGLENATQGPWAPQRCWVPVLSILVLVPSLRTLE